MVDAPNEPSGAMQTQFTDQKPVLDSSAIPMNEIGLRKSQSFSCHQVITDHRLIQPSEDSSTPILPDDLVEEKATLEFILRLLNEDDYIPSINEKKDKNWKLLPQILSEISFGLRRQALVKYIDGTRYFGKVPVKQINPEKSGGPASIEVVGPARPVLCPERAPEGCEFILAWREGNFWNWDLEEFQMVRDDLRPNDLIQQISREYSKYLNLMGRYAHSDSSSQAHFSRLILRLLDSRPIGQVIKLDGSVQLSNSLSTRNEDSVVVAFYCGVLFASKVMYEGAVANYHKKILEPKSIWPSIFRHALDRHGWDVDNDELFNKMNIKVENSNLSKKHKHVKMDNMHLYVAVNYGKLRDSVNAVKRSGEKTMNPKRALKRVKSLLNQESMPSRYENPKTPKKKTKEKGAPSEVDFDKVKNAVKNL